MPHLTEIKNRQKEKVAEKATFLLGEGGIRTLEPLVTVTRFPIARARPATRLLHSVFSFSDRSIRASAVFTESRLSVYHETQKKARPLAKIMPHFSRKTENFHLISVSIQASGSVRGPAVPQMPFTGGI